EVRSSNHIIGYEPCHARKAAAKAIDTRPITMTASHFSQGTGRSSGECAGKTLKNAYVTAGSGTVSSAQNASVGPRRNSGTMKSKLAIGAPPTKQPHHRT